MRKRTSRALVAITIVLGLVGCGQKGPLYLPEEAPKNTPETPSEDNRVRY